jgi:hypothetical protein
METVGLGYKNGNASACLSGYTYVDPYYPATADMLVNEIYINNADSGTNFKIGIGSLNGYVFTPRHYVTLSVVAMGGNTFNAPTDFTAFEVYEGEHIYFYSNSANARPDRTNWGDPNGTWYVSGDKMDEVSFTVAEYANTSEVQFRGEALGWDGADIDGIDPTNIDELDGLSLADIDEIDRI